jgi:hypothetical protein
MEVPIRFGDKRRAEPLVINRLSDHRSTQPHQLGCAIFSDWNVEMLQIVPDSSQRCVMASQDLNCHIFRALPSLLDSFVFEEAWLPKSEPSSNVLQLAAQDRELK